MRVFQENFDYSGGNSPQNIWFFFAIGIPYTIMNRMELYSRIQQRRCMNSGTYNKKAVFVPLGRLLYRGPEGYSKILHPVITLITPVVQVHIIY